MTKTSVNISQVPQMKFVTPYQNTKRVKTVIVGKSMTDQSAKDEVNINKILEKYDRTGVLTNINKSTPLYDDVSDVTSYKEAIDRVQETKERFDELPSELRAKFENDPLQMLEYLTNPENHDEMVKLGLAEYVDTPNVVDTPEGVSTQAAATETNETAPHGEQKK